ncbi:PTS transporter subunit EIIC [Levilactobacillus tujiorum]|uniref:PTS transporter subunit EIIC n=1 Tax=Levilactobacillus tujiorum TaxID=2912243 RepID=UPI001456F3FF|nr:PTS transporter subunit EIIC [Levilactobacillus tujiorum]NLR32999.1 PTS sugar transporter subunit IIC [Levilactobacillus tujiorum]
MAEHTGKLGRHLIDFDIKFRRNRQINAIYHALRLIFPLILVGTLADFINQTWLQRSGYYYQTLHVAKWAFQLKILRQYLGLVSAGTLGLTAILITFAVSVYLVAPVTPLIVDRLMAGIVAIIALKSLNVNRQSVLGNHPVQWLSNNLGLSGIFVGVLVGLLVGNGYRWLLNHQHATQRRLEQNVGGIALWLLVLTGLGFVWVSTQTVSLNAALLAISRWPFQLPHDLGTLLGFGLLTGTCQWLGILGPIASVGGQSIEAAQNLAAVLDHTGWQIPHPVTLHTVVDVYATSGGPGMVLALLLAIFLVRRNVRQRRMGWYCLIPTLGNFNAPLLIGLPVIFSPILLLPFLLAPLACITLSWGCLVLHWVPAVAYPLANGTPGILQAYLGTGGSGAALLLSVVELVLSTAIYYPFVKWAGIAEEAVSHEPTIS